MERRHTASVRLIWLLTPLLMLAGAQADDGVLIQHVPDGAENSQVLAVVQQAFIGRHWTIESVDQTSVTAVLTHLQYSARMRVYHSGSSLLYEESATAFKAGSGNPAAGGQVQHDRKSATPERWIANLQSDIAMALAVIPNGATPSKADSDPNGAAERLKVLEDLRKSGLISQEEYEQKRAEILRGL